MPDFLVQGPDPCPVEEKKGDGCPWLDRVLFDSLTHGWASWGSTGLHIHSLVRLAHYVRARPKKKRGWEYTPVCISE